MRLSADPRPFAVLFLLLGLFFAIPAQSFETSSLVIRSGGTEHRFTVELAITPQERSQGLMYRKSMAEDAGMLFDFGRVGRQAMWMKNTHIPLDMLFIRADGTIHRIAERTVPFSEDIIPSQGRVKAVLELNGGTADRLGIKPGDIVLHRMFGTAE
jgi:uncharacterized membrane protein (UPF0127 family)